MTGDRVTRLQRWLLIGALVVLAAFVTGLVRGLTDTVPADLQAPQGAPQSSQEAPPSAPQVLSYRIIKSESRRLR